MIGRIFSSAHFAVDPGRYALFRQAFARQNSVYAQPKIFFEGAHLIIPPAEKVSFLVMDSKGVLQAEAAQITKSGAFAVRSHDGSVPKVGIVNIYVLWSDIKISAHDEFGKFFFRKAASEPPIPLQFIFVCWRTNGLSIGRVNRKHAQLADGRCDQARLRIDYFIAKRRANLAQLVLRENRYAVVRFLSVIRRMIPRRLQSERRKLFVRAFGLLQANNVRPCYFKPCKQPVLPFAQRIDVPRGDFHHLAVAAVYEGRYNSNSTPGAATITSEPESWFDNVARIHSTAGGSPCTRRIFFGEIFFA
jgi:hypothetical protein